jgi:hypothetical protein
MNFSVRRSPFDRSFLENHRSRQNQSVADSGPDQQPVSLEAVDQPAPEPNAASSAADASPADC